MNGQHLKALPTEELLKSIGEQWTSAGILNESEGPFVEVRPMLPNVFLILFFIQLLRHCAYAAP